MLVTFGIIGFGILVLLISILAIIKISSKASKLEYYDKGWKDE